MKFPAFQLWWHTLRISVTLQFSHLLGECLGTSKNPSQSISFLSMKTPHLVPHPCQTWLTLRTQKSTSDELFSPRDFRRIKTKEALGFFFKQYEETVSHETAVPSNFNSTVFSQVEHDCYTSMWFSGNMAQSTEGTKTCFPAAAGKRSTYFGILTAREHMISNCFFQKN